MLFSALAEVRPAISGRYSSCRPFSIATPNPISSTNSTMVLATVLTTFLFLAGSCVFAHSGHDGMDGMDMPGMDDTTTVLTHGQMRMYFHFTASDSLWFDGWTPTSPGAMVGACIGLFLFAITERWVGAGRRIIEGYWRERGLVARSAGAPEQKTSSSDSTSDVPAIPHHPPNLKSRPNVPFNWSHDLARGALHAFQSAMGFALMLAVMSFNVGFILSIIIGAGVGEVMFGRFGGLDEHDGH